MKKLHIKKGDNVKVISGKYRGETGEVLRVIPQTDRAIVEGINMVSKHTKPSQTYPDGGIIEQEAAIHVSNLMIIDPKSKVPTRIGRKPAESGKGWVRYAKKSGELLP
ncbi:MAG: 50S ribosomal protein L24 [Bacteroidia bacterium]|nr:50S ribosomal protein L24 [Bacteroidia bacterium]